MTALAAVPIALAVAIMAVVARLIGQRVEIARATWRSEERTQAIMARMPSRERIQAVIDATPPHDPWLDVQHDWWP